MTPELIAAIVAVLGALATFLKSRSDISTVRDERARTASERDRDSLQLHDAVQRHDFEISRLKDDLGFANSRIDEQQKTAGILTTELAKISVKLDTVIEALKDKKS